jgi:hypothetical protein
MTVLALLLMPAQALAALCFTDSELGAVYVLELAGITGVFGSLVGAANLDCLDAQYFPLTGTGFLEAGGKARIALTVPASTSQCFPFTLQGALDPPAFNSGTGFFIESPGVFFRPDVVISPAPCP